ncbi:pepsin/retropepsin-like aspartic protease family protein [Serratia sp. D1N4]
MHVLLDRHITAMIVVLLFSAISLAVNATEKVMHIPFQLDDTSLPVTQVDIDGKRQTFSIDTGSSIALHLSKDLMAQLSGLIIDPEKERTTDLTGKIFLNDRFHIPQLSINGMLFKDVKGVSLTPWGMVLIPNGHIPTSMVIGLDLFKGKAVLIDYKGQNLSVADDVQALNVNVSDGWLALPLQLTQEGIVVNVSQRLQRYNMVLDTGASVSVFWKDRLKSSFTRLSCQTVMLEMDNKGCEATEFKLDGLGTENIKLNAVLLDGAFEHMETDGLIGNNFFKNFVVLIDFPGQRLLIKDNRSPE